MDLGQFGRGVRTGGLFSGELRIYGGVVYTSYMPSTNADFEAGRDSDDSIGDAAESRIVLSLQIFLDEQSINFFSPFTFVSSIKFL